MSKNVRQNRRREPKLTQIDKQGWKSLAIVVLKIAVTCILAIGIPYGIYLYYQHLVETDRFVPTSINIYGNLRVDDASIREASGLLADDANLFEVNVHTIEASIETLPWVKKAKVRIDLPDHVEIAISEHEPLGIVNDGQLHVVDINGVAIKLWNDGDDLMTPIVSIDGALDKHANAVVQAFELGSLITKLGFPDKIQEIHYDDATGYSIYTEETEIRLGYDRFDERISRLLLVHDILEKRKVNAEYILLDGDTSLDRIVVKPAPKQAANFIENQSDAPQKDAETAPAEVIQDNAKPDNSTTGDKT